MYSDLGSQLRNYRRTGRYGPDDEVLQIKRATGGIERD